MAWLRIDDSFDTHPKVLALGSAERKWTWVCVLIYTCRHRTPIVPKNIRNVVQKATPSFIRECIAVGLIDVSENGEMVVHDWDEYQAGDPRKTARQRRWRDAKVDADVDGHVDADVDGVVDASRAGARAFPSRPKNTDTSSEVSVRTPAQELVAWFVDESRQAGREPPSRVTGQIAQQIGQLLIETTTERIRAGLRIVIDKGLNPSTLPSAIYEAQAPRSNNRGVSAADLLAAADREEAVLDRR